MTVVLGAGVAAAATYGVLGWLVFIIDAISLGNSSICSVFILSDAFRLVSLLGIAIWRTSIIRDFVRLLYVSTDLISSCITSNCEFDCLAQRLIMLIKWFMKSLITGSEKEVRRSMQISVNNRSASDSAEENDAKSRAFKCAHVLIESGAPSNRPIMDDKGPRRSRWAMAVFKHSLWNVSPCGVFMALIWFSVSAMKAWTLNPVPSPLNLLEGMVTVTLIFVVSWLCDEEQPVDPVMFVSSVALVFSGCVSWLMAGRLG